MSFPTGFREGLGKASPINGTVSPPVFLLDYQTSIFSGVAFPSLPHLKQEVYRKKFKYYNLVSGG